MRDDNEGAELGPPPSARRRYDDAGRPIAATGADERNDLYDHIRGFLDRIERQVWWVFVIACASALLIAFAALYLAGSVNGR